MPGVESSRQREPLDFAVAVEEQVPAKGGGVGLHEGLAPLQIKK